MQLSRPLHSVRFHGALALAALLASAPAARAAESYDNCTGFIDSVPATIATQGVWCLRRDLSTAITSGNAITVANNNVTLDCNDFKLGGLAAGNGSNAHGIYANDRRNVTVRNCSVRGFHTGIRISGDGGGHLVEDNRLDNNLSMGILMHGAGNVVRRNRVFDTGGLAGFGASTGLWVEADVIDNAVDGVFADAANATVKGVVILGNGHLVRGNRVGALQATGSGTAFGIQVEYPYTRLEGNHVQNNNNGIAAGSIGIIANGEDSVCLDNSVRYFATAYTGCPHSVGNLP